jgi:hypothetical protein
MIEADGGTATVIIKKKKRLVHLFLKLYSNTSHASMQGRSKEEEEEDPNQL